MKIKVLSKKIYELIAAGEVISRPKFVVKELVENSIDACSKTISVEIKNGGKTLIRVVDDGVGISFDDCQLAFLRHATSKITNESDLCEIKTLGFRGEALASICAVSKVKLLTKIKHSEFGTYYENEGGRCVVCEKVSCNEGTNFSVENLFYNVPARLKFLKTDLTEANLIQDILEKLALSNSKIAFSFKKNGKKIFQTLGDGSLGNVIYNIFGREFFKTLVPVEGVFKKIQVTGFVSLPVFCRAKGYLNICFVNSRYVKSKIFKNGVDQAFKGRAMVGKSASFVLFLNMPFSEVDINVHPAKTEVRFVNELDVLKAIYLSVKRAIELTENVFDKTSFKTIKNSEDFCSSESENCNSVNPFEVDSIKLNKNAADSLCLEKGFSSKVQPYEVINKSANNFEKLNNVSENTVLSDLCEDVDFAYKSNGEDIKDLNLQVKNNSLKTDGFFDLKLIGEVFRTYILAEFKNKFIVIDKHAAHERIIYEKLKKELNSFEKQLLVSPIKFTINSSVDFELVLKNLNVFSYFGFEVERFGVHDVLIRSVPTFLSEENCLEVFFEIVENLKQNKLDLTPESVEKVLHFMACRAAVKANDENDIEQLLELVKKIYVDEKIRTCPHGRPVILVYSKEKFDSAFKRI